MKIKDEEQTANCITEVVIRCGSSIRSCKTEHKVNVKEMKQREKYPEETSAQNYTRQE